jgi:hypothetical protein
VSLTRDQTEQSLREMARDFSMHSREQMMRTGKPVTSMALVTTPDTIAVLTILDVSQHLAMFREAVVKLAATGVVFVHDGWTTIGDGARVDALMVLWASQWGTAEGQAFHYEKTPFGIRFSDVIDATPDHLAPYVSIFHE